MLITKNKIFNKILLFAIIVNLIIIFDIEHLYLRPILAFLFLMVIPGYLITLVLNIKKVPFWEYLVYIIGLSISFLIFGGLAVNQILPLLHVTDAPLSIEPLLLSFDIILLLIGSVAYQRANNTLILIEPLQSDALNKLFLILPLGFPVLSVLGVVTLNNGGSNYLTLMMLGGIAVYIFSVTLFNKKLNENIFYWAILMISFSLLLMASLRSWHITGWDIHHEYKVFQLTEKSYRWGMFNAPKDAYNACLSVTILPTVFSSFLNINNEYILKLIFQVLFSFVPITVFIFLKKYFRDIMVFLAVFFFLSQSQFTEMPWITRQEISFLFFILSLLVLFNNHLTGFTKAFLFLVFGLSIVVTHYSTAYVSIALLTFTYFVYLFFRKTENINFFSKIYTRLNLKKKKEETIYSYHIKGYAILILVFFTFLWSNQLTGTSDNLGHMVKMVFLNITKIFQEEMRSEAAQIAIGGAGNTYTLEDVRSYYDNITREYHQNNTEIRFYNPEQYADYTIMPRYAPIISPKNSTIKRLSEFLTRIIGRSLQLSILIGVFYFIFFLFKDYRNLAEYFLACVGSIFLLGIIIIIPYISVGYNLERLFLQTLIFLAVPAVSGIFLILFKLLKDKNTSIIYTLVSFLFVWYFLVLSGFIYQFVGGEPRIFLNNYGEMYERFYTFAPEVNSLEWLSQYNNQEDEIYMDEYSLLKARSFSTIDENRIILNMVPSIIGKNSYVYLNHVNKVQEAARVNNYKGKPLQYNFPIKFLNDNKNKIYNNGDSEIFK